MRYFHARRACLCALVLVLPTTTMAQFQVDIDAALSEPIPYMPAALGDFTHPISSPNETAQEFFDQGFQLMYAYGKLEAMVEGVPIVAQGKEIKAVTYHRLEVDETEDGLETRIVFDV